MLSNGQLARGQAARAGAHIAEPTAPGTPHHHSASSKNRSTREGLTIPFREPYVVRQVPRKLMVKAVDHGQHILNHEDSVIIPIEDP